MDEVKKAKTAKTNDKEGAVKSAPKASKADVKEKSPAKTGAAKKDPVKKASDAGAAKKEPAKKKAQNNVNKSKPHAHVHFLPDDEDDAIVLTDDNGKEVEFFQIACIEYGEDLYAILQPGEGIEGVDDDEAVIFKIEEEDEENDLFLPVEDEDLLDDIFNEYLKAVAASEEDGQDE